MCVGCITHENVEKEHSENSAIYNSNKNGELYQWLKMGNINIKNKEIAVPGEILAEGMDNFPGSGTFRDGENIIAAMVGLTIIDGRTIKLLPVSGTYIPKKFDTIICKV